MMMMVFPLKIYLNLRSTPPTMPLEAPTSMPSQSVVLRKQTLEQIRNLHPSPRQRPNRRQRPKVRQRQQQRKRQHPKQREKPQERQRQRIPRLWCWIQGPVKHSLPVKHRFPRGNASQGLQRPNVPRESVRISRFNQFHLTNVLHTKSFFDCMVYHFFSRFQRYPIFSNIERVSFWFVQIWTCDYVHGDGDSRVSVCVCTCVCGCVFVTVLYDIWYFFPQTQLRLIRDNEHYKLEPYWSRRQVGVRKVEGKHHAYLVTESSMKLNIEVGNSVFSRLILVIPKHRQQTWVHENYINLKECNNILSSRWWILAGLPHLVIASWVITNL